MEKIIYPLNVKTRGPATANLQDALQLLLERKALLSDPDQIRKIAGGLRDEQASQTYAKVTQTLVAYFQKSRNLQPTGEVDEATASALNAWLEQLGAFHKVEYNVNGRVKSRTSAAVGRLRVEVVDRGVGGDMVLAEAETDSSGRYQVSFSQAAVRKRGKQQPDLQVKAFHGERLLAASEVRYGASSHETLDIFLDERVSVELSSEYDALTGALSAHYAGKLRELQETDQHQDVTYLANKSGWDARAIALVSLADRFGGAPATERSSAAAIEPAFFYALFRAGLPASEAVYRTEPATVKRIWTQAIEQNVIPGELRERIPQALEQFEQAAAGTLLQGPPLAGASSFGDLLELSLGDNVQEQQLVATLYARHAEDPARFWEAVQGALGEAKTARLRLDGQLAYLTLNNAPLIRAVHAAAGSSGMRDPAQLVDAGFHRAAVWRQAIGTTPVPPEIPGKDDAERRDRYADLLAAQVRLAFPTGVVAQMVASGDTPIVTPDLRGQVQTFLARNQIDFAIGAQPVRQYVARRGMEVTPEVIGEVTRIQRVYQITPDDQAMNGLLKKGIDSAHAVVRYERDEFVRAFQADVGGADNAELIHAKAQQVHTAALNVAIGFLTARTAPAVGVHSPASIIAPQPSPPANASDVLAYSTLEGLFGELDYCACEHCRSILSPAAYLVDLLMFIDRPASEVPAGFTNPLTVLLDRRPDIQHLPLTCDNTNTPLPYIDLVNETLEHYVANGLSLAAYVGHDTDGSATPEELLATPQFVSEAAYTALAAENFPPPLPLQQPLENLRRFFRRFEAPLPEVMAELRKNDVLERASAADYGWRDIWMETLGLSRPEHRLLTERWLTADVTDVMLTIKQLYGFDSATSDADVRAVLDDAKSFCRRVDISYEDLVDILRTRFVNPNSHLIPRLERLGLSFATLSDFENGTLSDVEFDALLPAGLDPAQYGGDIKAWVKDDANQARIMALITLTETGDAEDTCSFENVQLRYANPDTSANALRPFEFVRLIRFIRLWKKLGWTIEETDKAITALYPEAQAPTDPDDAVNLERLDAGFLVLLPRLGVLARLVTLLKLTPKKDLLSLLSCFAPIDTHGETSLYRQMFLGPSQLDEAFAEDGFGNYLADATEPLLDHASTLRAAFSLTAIEFDDITTALGYDAVTPLALDAISAVYRHGWLARKLKLSVREFLLLTRLTGHDPFAAADPVSPAGVLLVELVARLRALGIKPVQVLYLMWNQDLSGKSEPVRSDINAFARTLRGALAAIDSEFALVDDPDGSIARARMALVYGDVATNLFFGLLERTFVSEVAYGHVDAALAEPILDVAPGLIAYDDFRKRLSFAGILDTSTRDALKAVVGATSAFQAAVDALYVENRSVIGPFFDRYPELLPLHDAYAASGAPPAERRNALLAAFLPDLQLRRKRQQALQSISAAAGADLDLASVFLEDSAVLHAAGDASRSALDDLIAAETGGLTAQFFDAPTATGTPALVRDVEPVLDYDPTGIAALPGNGTTLGAAISGIWSGWLEAPEKGFYNVQIDTEATATVGFTLDGVAISLTQTGGTWRNTDPIDLRVGTLHAVTLTVESLTDRLAVRWQTAGRGWEIIPAPYLYPQTLTDHLRDVYVRFLKAAALAAGLRLTPAEIAHLAADADYRIGGEGWLNRLPVIGDPDAATAVALSEVLVGLVDYARIKASLSPGDERLLEVMRDPVAATAEPDSLLYVLSRWDQGSVEALLAHFGKAAADLTHVDVLGRIHDACGWVTRLGVSAPALIQATTNEPSSAVVRDLQAALRARYDESSWLDVLRPINDEMRSVQRDALVAYILHRMRSTPASAHIDTPEKLFEYFLMDVQMSTCMLTSRIRNALSSTQLFIERCLMNLEPRVSPASIKAKHWEWMKRYRVWEANRKVFLFPENWLEPELRDDQSPMFKETMSELLQGDITEDRAAKALLGYLTRLEEVAKLEICGVHFEENEAGTADDVAHVIARTAGGKRKYYYRRREYPNWTPWEKITLDIEDNPVLPVVWRDRVFLFWLKLVQETQQNAPPSPGSSKLADVSASSVFPNQVPRLTVKAILNWSEYLDGSWQPARTSDPARPLFLGTFDLTGNGAFDRTRLKLSALFWSNGLRIIVSNQVGSGSSFFLYNPFSTPELRDSKKGAHFAPRRALDTTTTSLKVTYADTGASHPVVDNAITDGTIDPHHPLGGTPWDAPFFYEDNRHAFFVTTSEQLVTVVKWHDFGVIPKTVAPVVELPPLVIKPGLKYLDVATPTVRQPGFGVIDPSPIDYFITEDAHIENAIGTPGTVRFGDKDIGPSGSQFKTTRVR